MVKELYLVRHGQAEPQSGSTKDFQRQLTSKGYQDASKIGLYLKSKEFYPDIILHSSSVRTTDTVNRINEQLGIDLDHIESSEEIYEASVRILLRVISEIPAELRSAIIVGHNPSITYLSEYITGAEIGHVGTAGMVHIQIPFTSWSEVSEKNCDFIEYISPEDIY
ncbi:phosphoglycerate mutase [Marivirga lumbricoides]|uniref:Phosphoglycerate mutase n=1 Tax=Marivirga lumbricoides TaxID=1046115 RepID=A0ABQ1LH41_9BACT|nr:phosphoglycerate mutase [Marivirga lumbricoides]